MSRHAMGKEAWEALPNIFSDSKLAEGLEDGARLWSYTYMFPSTAQPGRTCIMDAGVSYSRSTGLFTKWIQNAGVE